MYNNQFLYFINYINILYIYILFFCNLNDRLYGLLILLIVSSHFILKSCLLNLINNFLSTIDILRHLKS